MAERADTFIDALHTLEADQDVEPIAALFAPDADVSNPMVKHTGEGRQGAASFWRAYRMAFDRIESSFRNIVDHDKLVVLEWSSTGTMEGERVRYGGVSVIEYGDAGITAFRTYFDPTPLKTTASAKDT